MDSSIPVAEPPADENAPKSNAPVMDVTPPPPAQSAPNPASDTHETVKPSKRPAANDLQAVNHTKETESDVSPKGVGLAIIATVIIVVVLAALATYAYVKTK